MSYSIRELSYAAKPKNWLYPYSELTLMVKNGKGVKQAEVFRLSGLDWGEKRKATSSNQQYWVVALLRELEDEGLVEQVEEKGPWRLR